MVRTRILTPLSVVPLSAALLIGSAATANAAVAAPPPAGCTVSVQTRQGHEVGMRTITGRGTVTCSSIMRPMISINLRKGGDIKSKARKDCKREKKCTAYTDTIFKAQGFDWCTQVVADWGITSTIKWDCL